MKTIRLLICLALLLSLLPGADCRADTISVKADDHAVFDAGIVSLDKCVRFAVNNSFEIRLAKLDFYIAETDLMYVEAVFDAFLYGGASHTRDKRQELSVFAPDDDMINEYSAGISKTLPTGTELNLKVEDRRLWNDYPGQSYVRANPSHTAQWTLDIIQPVGKNTFGFVDRKTITLTKLAIENADLVMKDEIEGVIARTEKAYWELVLRKMALEIFSDMLEKAEKLHEADEKRFDIGLIERVDLLNSEAIVATSKADVLIAENSRRRAEEDLKLIMNLGEDHSVRPVEKLEARLIERDLAYCLKEAFQKRRDYHEKKRDVDIMGLNLRIKDNMLWPEIDLIGSMAINGVSGKFKTAVGRTTLADNAYYYGGIEFSIPIENREARSEFIKAKYEKEDAIVKLKEVERTIITEVGNAFRDVVVYEASLVYLKKAVELQSEKLEAETKRFKQGRSGTKRVVDYMRDLLLAELDNARFLLKHRKAKVDLDRSMNIILEKYESIL
jgi:outer membrane protein TolC